MSLLSLQGRTMCLGSLGKTTYDYDLCAAEDGETIHFSYYDTGAVGTSLSEELSTGILKAEKLFLILVVINRNQHFSRHPDIC